MKVGQAVRVTYYPVHLPGSQATVKGRVCYKNDFYFTVQFKNFKESFVHGDKNIIVEVLDGNKKAV